MSENGLYGVSSNFDLILSMYNKLRAVIFICDLEGSILEANNVSEKYLKYQRRDLIGKGIRELIISEDHEKFDFLCNNPESDEAYWEINFSTCDNHLLILNCYRISMNGLNVFIGRYNDPIAIKFQEELMLINNQVTNLYRELERKNRQLEEMNKILEQQRKEIDEKNAEISRQLEISRKIQAHFVKNGTMQLYNLLFKFEYVPAYDIGGDYFDVIDLNNGKVGIFISDVSGHGISAALIMAVVKTMFQKQSVNYEMPQKLLHGINEELYELFGENFTEIYCTAFYCVIDTRTMSIEFCSAGHPAAWICNEKKKENMEVRGFPLGLFKGVSYESSFVKYDSKDKLVFYTDGLTDFVLKCDFEQVDCMKLYDDIKNSRISGLMNQDEKVKDDVSIVLVEVNEVEE